MALEELYELPPQIFRGHQSYSTRHKYWRAGISVGRTIVINKYFIISKAIYQSMDLKPVLGSHLNHYGQIGDERERLSKCSL